MPWYSLLVVVFLGAAEGKIERESRISIFNVVSFRNLECASSDLTAGSGTCFSTMDCNDKGGRASGNCASGFGVCCLFIANSCGSVLSRNNSYFRNPGFPNSFIVSTPTVCSFTIRRCQDNICTLRLDFDNLVTSEPPNGMCGTSNFDKITITSPSGFNPPGPGGLCGDGLSGMHIYVDTSLSGTVDFSIAAGTATALSRSWNIKVTQLACDDRNRPPQGCTQFFMGVGGSIKSYNFDGGVINSGHLISNCVRREEGFCSINYFAMGDGDFKLNSGNKLVSQSSAVANVIDCDNTAVIIPSVIVTPATMQIWEFCGGKFSPASLQQQHGVATSTAIPFRFSFRSKATSDNTGLAGFNLMYVQVPC